ncbi:MAG: hypothetical protein VCB99_06370 [Myxococcota bacterium]
MSCRDTQWRLESDHERPSSADLEHLSRCAECTAHRALLRELYAEARASVSVPPTLALLNQVEGQARAALRRANAPSPLRREILLPLGIALFALPIALAQGWLWLKGLFLLGEAWLPAPFLTGISLFYIATAGLTLGALYASLPFAVVYANRVKPETS